MFQRVILACFLIFLTACATSKNLAKPITVSKPAQGFAQLGIHLYALDEWSLTGKISIQYKDRTEIGNLLWEEKGDRYLIVLYGPGGFGGVRIEGDRGHVKVTSDRGVAEASSPEILVQQLYGWDLPVSALHVWIKGLPLPFEPFEQTHDALGYPKEIQQSGWTIHYQDYIELHNLVLPTKLKLENADMKIVIKVQEWAL